MQVAANRVRLTLELGGLSLPVLALEGEEGLSEISRFRLEVLAVAGTALSSLLGSAGILRFSGPRGRSRAVGGIVTSLEEIGRHTDGRPRVALVLESSLALLRLGEESRIFLGRTVPELAREVLERHGLEGRCRLHLVADYPVRPWTVQAQESDFSFLGRQLAKAGIFWWSGCEDGDEVLHFGDANAVLPAVEDVISFRRPAGLPAAAVGGPFGDLSSALANLLPGDAGEGGAFHFLAARSNMIPGEVAVHGVCERFPAIPLLASARTAATERSMASTHFATGALCLEGAEREARLRAERAGVDSFGLHARGDVADLFPGAVFTLDSGFFGSDYTGEWIVERLTHRAAQRAGEGASGDDLPYLCEARLIRACTPFRPVIPPNPELPLVFSARIESDAPYARLDEEGRYKLRPFFDQAGTPHAEASIPIRRMTPHASPPGDLPSGWHTPLHDGAEVLLSCLNSDPDQPMIAGTLPNPATLSPTTCANPTQNLLRTAGDSELLLDDKKDAEVIRLRTFAGHNLLELNAAVVGHTLALASKQGAMQLEAKKTMTITSGDSVTEQVGGDRLHDVQKNHRTETKQGEIHHQAKTDITQQAGKSIHLQAARNIEFTSGKRIRIDADRNARVTVQQGDASFTVHNGQVHIQSAKEIDIRGQGGGDIAFAQSGGGFTIKPDGKVILFGKIVSLKADQLTLDGPVDYVTSGGALPGMPGAIAPLAVQEISLLKPEGNSQIVDLAWSRNQVPVGEPVEACFTVRNFRGGEKAEIAVFETNEDGSRREVDRLRRPLDSGFGTFRVPWERSVDQGGEDVVNDENAGDRQPLTYVFQVEIEGVRSEISPGVNLTSTLSFAPVDQDGVPVPDGTELHLTDAHGRRHVARVESGEAFFEEVVLGPWQLHIAADNLIATQEG